MKTMTSSAPSTYWSFKKQIYKLTYIHSDTYKDMDHLVSPSKKQGLDYTSGCKTSF